MVFRRDPRTKHGRPADETILSLEDNVRKQRVARFAIRRIPMLEVDHYRFQADRARRMADRVTDTTVRERLLEMAVEFNRYAALIEAKVREKMALAS
jgi:hypothetical protein